MKGCWRSSTRGGAGIPIADAGRPVDQLPWTLGDSFGSRNSGTDRDYRLKRTEFGAVQAKLAPLLAADRLVVMRVYGVGRLACQEGKNEQQRVGEAAPGAQKPTHGDSSHHG